MNPFRYTKRADAPARVAGDGERQGFGQPPAQQLDDRRGPAVQQQATAPKPALRAEASQVVAFDGLLVFQTARDISEVERRGAGHADAAREPPPI